MGMYIDAAARKNSMAVPPKIKTRAAICPSRSASEHISKGNGNGIWGWGLQPTLTAALR